MIGGILIGAAVSFVLYCMFDWRDRSKRPCEHKYFNLYSSYLGSGEYKYFRDEYDFCIRCGEKLIEYAEGTYVRIV
jgi:hypothetical protein